MSALSEQFVSQFHSLCGTTIGERRKNLFELLNRTTDVDTIEFDKIVPTTLLEGSFLVETLVRYRRVLELFRLLLSGDPHLVNVTLQHSSAFLLKALEDFSGQGFADDVLPLVSFNTRVKVRRKLQEV